MCSSYAQMTFDRFILVCCAGFTLLTSVAHAFDQTHAGLDRVLKPHVREGAVNYAALKAAPGELKAYLAELAAVTEPAFKGWSEQDQLAYLINLYNAATLQLIIENYPVKSIRSIGFIPGRAWKKEFISLFGRNVSLDHVEHDIIRKNYRDARVHFALVCAAQSCPPLRFEPFVGIRLDAQLDEQGRIFLAQETNNRVEASSRTVHLSPIFQWFAGDFEAEAGSVLKFVTPFFPDTAQAALTGSGEFKVAFTDYDWSLNQQGSR